MKNNCWGRTSMTAGTWSWPSRDGPRRWWRRPTDRRTTRRRRSSRRTRGVVGFAGLPLAALMVWTMRMTSPGSDTCELALPSANSASPLEAVPGEQLQRYQLSGADLGRRGTRMGAGHRAGGRGTRRSAGARGPAATSRPAPTTAPPARVPDRNVLRVTPHLTITPSRHALHRGLPYSREAHPSSGSAERAPTISASARFPSGKAAACSGSSVLPYPPPNSTACARMSNGVHLMEIHSLAPAGCQRTHMVS